MSVIIRKQETGEVFDLPTDYIIEGDKTNPLFEKKGSQTVPITFPATVRNNRLLEFSYRLDKTEKPKETIEVIVDTGSAQQHGLLYMNGRSGNIGFDESEMYIQFAKMQLRDILGLPVLSFGGNNTDERVDSMLGHLTAVMKMQTEAEYYVFPVLMDRENNEILNDINAGYNSNVPLGELKALENRMISRGTLNDPIKIQAPKGYGVSPFIKVWRILELIFDHFGFKIEENTFKNHRQLKKLVVLNNTMDAVLTGTLYYKDMMPDITINEFLDALFAKFGMLYFIDSNSRHVRLQFLKDLVKPNAYEPIDLSKLITAEPVVSNSSPKQLRLKMNREMEHAKTLYDSWQEFLKNFVNQFSTSGPATQTFDGKYSLYTIINIFKMYAGEDGRLDSSDFFDWDQKDDIPYEDIDMKDLCLPFSKYDLLNILEYTIPFKHAYSDVVIQGEKQENVENPGKLAFAFGWGLQHKSNFDYFFASQINRDYNGNFIYDENEEKYDISLTCNREDGLYNRFWKEYDAFIRYSNREVNCNLHLSDREILNMKMDRTAFIQNQPLIMRSLKYKLNQPGSLSECIFRTLRLYKPYDLSEEKLIPGYEPQMYYWAADLVEIFDEDISSLPPPDVFRKGIPEYIYEKYFTVNGVQVPMNYVSYLPPTEEQVQNEETRIYHYSTNYIGHLKTTVGGVDYWTEKTYHGHSTITFTALPIN
ncbi:MAG: hypothetical protein LBO74_16855 [Candidatus Symbiothrix sp.]|jgi:hypothetical protein|nr:hypothetical protein [Candidatus Symbiothrix sp.]